MNIEEIKELADKENIIKPTKETIENLARSIDADIISSLSIMENQHVPTKNRTLWDGEKFITQRKDT